MYKNQCLVRFPIFVWNFLLHALSAPPTASLLSLTHAAHQFLSFREWNFSLSRMELLRYRSNRIIKFAECCRQASNSGRVEEVRDREREEGGGGTRDSLLPFTSSATCIEVHLLLLTNELRSEANHIWNFALPRRAKLLVQPTQLMRNLKA